ncbi:RHS repeat-associated core domain-containing protein [Actinacidiphila guanduensis]|uniref:RHS repeat-associated core domain-containing protein n=1 Tax=Actinacidiphila guanduensis TaxID=310781 RepID=A0A1H0SQB4_9ACTN|nr:RHS repeat-associated core domain-containing protein [Actinacidiphila guanduensis]SDP43914.1 RHS repeat-associated core domain-containing protein [Actinacidiphila guanduensis]
MHLPLDTAVAPTALAYDEFGNPEPGTSTIRYGWLGGKQRSSETVTGATLMGARLYDPTTGRFLQTDPVPGGSANAYDYCTADPINCYDLNGQWGWHWHHWRHTARRATNFYCSWIDFCTHYSVSGALPHRIKPKKVNEGRLFKSREEAERQAREDARHGGRCFYRGPCRKADHVHVDWLNKAGEIVRTFHYRWLLKGDE